MRSKNIYVFILFTILFSCKEDIGKITVNKNQIISLLFDSIAKPLKLVYPPLGRVYTHKDSVKIDSIHNIIRYNRKTEKFKVGIFKNFRNDYYTKYNFLKLDGNCKNVQDLVSEFNSTEDNRTIIDIRSFNRKANDSIFFVDKSFFNERNKKFNKVDLVLTFSDVAFNKDYTQAVLFVNTSRGRKAGVLILYYLEKQKNKWEVLCTKELMTS